MTKLFGFTLAEVLITLGIIGVVAALTMPVLLGSATSIRFKSQFKKTLSVLNQSVKLYSAHNNIDLSSDLADNGDYDVWARILLENINGISNINTRSGVALDYYRNFQNEYLHVYDGNSYLLYDFGGYDSTYLMPDGALFVYDNKSSCSLRQGLNIRDALVNVKSDINADGSINSVSILNCIGFIDVNGFNPPNKEVTCVDGTVSGDINEPCKLSKTKINDIFPVVYYDSTIMPATNAARAVLDGN